MANNRRKAERRQEIELLRLEGRGARINGLPRSAVPWKPFQSTNGDHWLNGWDTQDEELRQQHENEEHCAVTDLISEVDDRETQEALYAIFEYVKQKLG